MGGGREGGLDPWDQKTSTFCFSGWTQGLKSIRESSPTHPFPPSTQTRQAGNFLPSCPVLTLPTWGGGNTSGNVSPRNPFSPQQHWHQPRSAHHPSIRLSRKNKSSLFPVGGCGAVDQSQTFTVHTCSPQTVS